MKNYLWTMRRARLCCVKSNNHANLNWLFLPGGPGLGSESLKGLTDCLDVPGSLWHLDLPGDGSNLDSDNKKAFSSWSEALVEAASALPNAILVGHSTGGMYALATPALEKHLIGLVLLDSAPDSSWQATFNQFAQNNPIKDVESLHTKYSKKPNNDLLKKITLACASYSFTKKGLERGISLLQDLPYNHESCAWSAEYFDHCYEAKWVPKKIPTMILSGELDQIIPLEFFSSAKKFQRPNIMFRSIKNAAHFPWVENPKEVKTAFKEYSINVHRVKKIS